MAAVVIVALGVVGVLVPAAGAQDDRPTAAVSLGDSYISGEAGRWEGNSSSDWGDRRGTDRAAYRRGWFWRYDESRVYGESGATGCHRSDVAPILSAGLSVDASVNLACSGADTADIRRAANGGTTHRGEAPQADQLAAFAATHDIELVVLSVGGNDLGFAGIIVACVLDYSTSVSWWQNHCNPEQQAAVDARMPAAMDGVAAAIADVRAVLDEAGQPPDSYRFVLATYPSPIPRGADFRYRESGWSRTFTGGCPVWDADADWARDSLVPQISDALAGVASAAGVELLDLRDAFEGRESCAASAAQGNGADAEWARFISTGLLQGEIQESAHPNAIGQRAIGTCISLVVAAPVGDHACTNTPGAGPEAMSLATSAFAP
ncbi:MAG: GDSL-type esterase/lipase family protein [Actinomycetota bacterium]